MNRNDALRLENATKSFEDLVVVQHVNTTVEQGTLTALLGPSGCGKTTLLRMIAGLETPDEGTIWLNEQPLFQDRPRIHVPPHRRAIGMVFQDYGLWPHMTVERTVAYPLRATKGRHRRGRVPSAVHEVLSQVRLSGLENRLPHQLSGGERQRVALARALVRHPELLLLDEPLSNLDAQLRKRMRSELRHLVQATPITVLHVTHDQAEALAISDQMIVMSSGQIEQTGAPETLYESPRTAFVAQFVGDANLLSAHAEHVDGATRLRLPDGSVLACAGLDVGPVEDVYGVHPHDVSLEASSSSSNVIVDRHYMGDSWHYDVRVGDTTLRVQAPIREIYDIGSGVHLSLRHVSRVRSSTTETETHLLTRPNPRQQSSEPPRKRRIGGRRRSRRHDRIRPNGYRNQSSD